MNDTTRAPRPRRIAVFTRVADAPGAVDAEVWDVRRGGCAMRAVPAPSIGEEGVLSVQVGERWVSRPVRVARVERDTVSLTFSPARDLDPAWADLAEDL